MTIRKRVIMMHSLGLTKKLVVAMMMIAALSLSCQTGYGLAQEEGFVNFKGRIVKIMGDVKMLPAGEKKWVEAKQGMDVGVKDVIKTGAESSVDIVFNRKGQRSKIRVLENADMSLMTLNLDKVTGDSEILLDLVIGHIIIKTDPLKGKSRFEVLTPTSMTAVRGTGFEVIVKKNKGPIGNGDIAQ